MTGSVLVLGANGRFGRHAAEAFWNAGWTVALFDRRTDDLTAKARRADVIVNGWNPPYPRWQTEVPSLTDKVIAAARASGATVLLPGNVYTFGKDAPALFGVKTPHRANNPLGQVRTRMEATYRASGVRTIILRCGDFLDTQPSGNWFDRVVAARLPKGPLRYPGALDVPHAWAWLPDVARAAVALAERRNSLPTFADIPFAGYTLTGAELAEACSRALGQPVAVVRMSWLPILALAPVWRMARHLAEMRYLWDKPHRLDPAPLAALLPRFHATPVEEALAQTLHRPGSDIRPAGAPNAMARA